MPTFTEFKESIQREMVKDEERTLSDEAIEEIYDYLVEMEHLGEKFPDKLEDVIYNFGEEHFSIIAQNIGLNISGLERYEAFDLVYDELDKMMPVIYGSQLSGLIVYEEH